jgi:hypothetical protein
MAWSLMPVRQSRLLSNLGIGADPILRVRVNRPDTDSSVHSSPFKDNLVKGQHQVLNLARAHRPLEHLIKQGRKKPG